MVMDRLARRLEKIEKELGSEDEIQWLRLPDHNNPGQFIEFKGCRGFADLIVMAAKQKAIKSNGM